MENTPDPTGFAGRERRAARMGNLFCAGAMLTWAAGFPASEILLETWDPLALIAARLLMAVAVLLPLWMLVEGPAAVLGARWGRGTLVGGVGFGIGTWLILYAQWASDPVTVAILASATPVCATIVEIVMDGRRVGRPFLMGLAASVAGGIVATGGAGSDATLISVGAVVGSGFLFSWGSRAAVRDLPDQSALGRSTLTLAGALLFAGSAFFIAETLGLAEGPRAPVDTRQVGLLAVYALGAMALSQLLWIASIGRLGVALASFHLNTAPFYVMLFMAAMGAGWNWMQALGAAIVGLGVILAQRRS